MRTISSKALLRDDTKDVNLRGKYLPGRKQDLPTMIWFSDILEPAENFEKFFADENHKILDVRNVWLLNIRNMGNSDHHESFDMFEISDDVRRFMDQQEITMATFGGHGFGAKVALATAINNMERSTGVIQMDGGPLDHTNYEAYHELRDFVNIANDMNLKEFDYATAVRFLKENISCEKWASIFIQNIEDKGSSIVWRGNVAQIAEEMKMRECNLAVWK